MASVTTDLHLKASGAHFSDMVMGVLETLARLSPTYRRLQDLSDTSDAELAARGMTRQEAARAIFGARFYA